ncbi:5'/3'-nucleotidase SurE [Micromonospora sagamiensis]|uniref:5'-nucleotidase n=1 Tax=Micromonospora sagamiensis TaxID=47875 RepID=A0A562WCA7_9ACTN|nr:5'/3'-nucleotidase SurE [Micromonospora sagamiensis]TWJ27892.1 5'-nucleotidase [Micromonospora sagamiensis]BCL13218.1 5'/3'-nucleotidase SurE [Micromonospora sagamiensis]
MSLRVLVTNDDGVAAPGLARLAQAAVARGLDVVVAAPLEEASGTSASMTALEREGHVVVRAHPLPELPDVPVYGVGGSPGFIVLIAVHGAFGPPPTVVLSGVNRGANAGRAVLHSGTVGAAFTAAANGCRAMAVSLDVLSAADVTPGSGGAAVHPAVRVRDTERHWSTAARVALDLLPRLTAGPAESVLNVNAPDLPYERLRGVRRASLASFGQVQMTVAEAGHGFVRTSLEEPGQAVQPGTDLFWLAEEYACVTAIRAVIEVADVDLSGLSGEEWRPA